MLKDLAKGPLHYVKTYSGYYVNGYKFQTEERCRNSRATNNGLCIKGSSHSSTELEYYGRLEEVLELEYPALPIKRTVLFRCSWFDPTINRGMQLHPQYKLVDVKKGRVFNKYEPFIFAEQASQVYFISYPSLRRDSTDWLAVCKIKARSVVEVAEVADMNVLPSDVMPFQEDVIEQREIHHVDIDHIPQTLNDANGGFVDIEETEIDNVAWNTDFSADNSNDDADDSNEDASTEVVAEGQDGYDAEEDEEYDTDL